MSGEGHSRGGKLKHAIDHAAHLLPAQGPIGVFIHHNTLHAFQHLPFEEAVLEAGRLFGAEPYMTESRFAKELAAGRILAEDIDAVLEREANAEVLPGVDLRRMRRTVLLEGIRPRGGASAEWRLAETALGMDVRRDALLWEQCAGLAQAREPEVTAALRPRDGVRALTGVDTDEVVHPVLTRLCAVYTDQGVSYWPMPDREKGFYPGVRKLLATWNAVYPEHLEGLGAELRQQQEARLTAEQAVVQALERLGIAESEWDALIEAELLALPGWAGMMRRLEEEPGLAPHHRLPCSLMDFLAVRLTLTVVAARNLTGNARKWLDGEPAAAASEDRLERALHLFETFRALGVDGKTLAGLSDGRREEAAAVILGFDSIERRRVMHMAYERRHEHLILDPLLRYRAAGAAGLGSPQARAVDAQVFFCIDEREESIRRHLEEVAPGVETYGAAGFFGVAVDFQGIDDAHGAAFCPVVVKPAHAVREEPVEEDRELHEQRQTRRKMWAQMARTSLLSSRTLVRGWVSTALLGLLSMFPLIAHVLAPRRYAKLRASLNDAFLPEPRTEVTLERRDEHGHHLAEGLLLGFSIQEKVDRVASVLAPTGLTREFARLVAILGHGSTSLNNPHESAHDCGACGGRRGGPNARLFAAMANHPEVRKGLAARGIVIPEDTWFLGGYHDTCSDDVVFFDETLMPETHVADLDRLRSWLNEARARNAGERARRFEAARGVRTPEQALWHVEERSEHLAEPRPEYGHCTNSCCVVGRRELTKGLFFDRRAFLISYDPTHDTGGENLAKLLGAAVPVCAGISLEYYFSFVDNEVYGCGTKLPHNITGLVGVMNGHASDLRTGLPWQMVEIHEPVRILFTIETTPEILLPIVKANALINEFVSNRWVRVATLDPVTGEAHVYRDGVFERYEPKPVELPRAAASAAWYGGRMEHLPVALIGAAGKDRAA